MRFDLSDEEWSVLEPLMPKRRQSAGPHDRRIINAIFYVLRTGIPWRDLPERYGPYTSAYHRFNRWSRRVSIGSGTKKNFCCRIKDWRLIALRQTRSKFPCRRVR